MKMTRIVMFVTTLGLIVVGMSGLARMYCRQTLHKLPEFFGGLGGAAIVLQIVWLLVGYKFWQVLTTDGTFSWEVAQPWTNQSSYPIASPTFLAFLAWAAALLAWLFDRRRGFSLRDTSD